MALGQESISANVEEFSELTLFLASPTSSMSTINGPVDGKKYVLHLANFIVVISDVRGSIAASIKIPKRPQ